MDKHFQEQLRKNHSQKLVTHKQLQRRSTKLCTKQSKSPFSRQQFFFIIFNIINKTYPRLYGDSIWVKTLYDKLFLAFQVSRHITTNSPARFAVWIMVLLGLYKSNSGPAGFNSMIVLIPPRFTVFPAEPTGKILIYI